MELQDLTAQLKSAINDIKAGRDEGLIEVKSRLGEIEQRLVRRSGGMAPETKSWGQALIESDGFKSLAAAPSQRGKARVEVKTVNIITTGGTAPAGSMVAPDVQTDPVMLPRRRMTIRGLIAPGRTSGNVIFYPKQTARQLNAAVVAEGTRKPQSDFTFAQVQAPVQTVAHFTKASRQILDDAPMLQSTIDSELRYGLQLAEEAELLNGDGTGVHLMGIIPQATTFSPPFTGDGDTAVDVLLQAIAQAELALLPCTGIVLNSLDWFKMLAIKDGMGRYLSNGPFGPANSRALWDLPVAPTLAIPAGHFLTGAFLDGAQIFDRLDAEVLVSTENEDDFVNNLVTIRAEERLALAVKRPAAFIYGAFPT